MPTKHLAKKNPMRRFFRGESSRAREEEPPAGRRGRNVRRNEEEQRAKRIDDRRSQLFRNDEARARFEGDFNVRTIIPPRYIDFLDLEEVMIFEQIDYIITSQGWRKFMGSNEKYYPNLVRMFYANMYEDGERRFTFVKGKQICLDPALLAASLDIPNIGRCQIDLFNCLPARKLVSGNFYDNGQGALNANWFEPLFHMLHHIIVTMIHPKVGSRDGVTKDHLFFMWYMYHGEQINLPLLMSQRMWEMSRIASRGLGYATAITKILKGARVDLTNEKSISVRNANVYNMKHLQKMGYIEEEGEIHRNLINISDDSEGENGEEEYEEEEHEEEEEERGEEGAEREEAAERESGPQFAGGAGTYFPSRDEWDGLSHSIEALHQDIGHLTGEVDRLSIHQNHVDNQLANILQNQANYAHEQSHQSTMLQNMWDFLTQQHPPPNP